MTRPENSGLRWTLTWEPPGDLPATARVYGRSLAAASSPPPPPSLLHESPEAGRLFVGVDSEMQEPLARLDQVHGNAVAAVNCAGTTKATDAAVTTIAGLPLTVRTADCVPILLAGPGGVGAVHAGWRGTADRIAFLAARRLAEIAGTGPPQLAAWIGPSIGPCCYEVGPEVAGRFDDVVVDRSRGRERLDLVLANRRQLEEAGLRPERIMNPLLCTRCHQHLLHSHRGSGGKKGRLDALVMLRT